MALMAAVLNFWRVLLILGFLTRPVSFVLAITMLVAIFTVHIDNGLFMANNGYEFGLALIAITLALFIQGGGKYSIDERIYQALNKAA